MISGGDDHDHDSDRKVKGETINEMKEGGSRDINGLEWEGKSQQTGIDRMKEFFLVWFRHLLDRSPRSLLLFSSSPPRSFPVALSAL